MFILVGVYLRYTVGLSCHALDWPICIAILHNHLIASTPT
uniref:Uncharacterized protein n=1 Tax=Anguilla anguilla TaxID=7936 RepID=A0A0E9VES3_ANGAN